MRYSEILLTILTCFIWRKDNSLRTTIKLITSLWTKFGIQILRLAQIFGILENTNEIKTNDTPLTLDGEEISIKWGV